MYLSTAITNPLSLARLTTWRPLEPQPTSRTTPPDLDLFARVKQWEWEKWHHRFGLAGEGQADVIEQLLQRSPGVVLDVGFGPNGRHVVNLAKLSGFVIAVDKYIEALRRARTDGPMPPNVAFLAGNASGLPW